MALIWAEDYNIHITNFCRITTCNDRRINRVHLTFSLYTKEFNTTAFIHLHIYDVYVNIILCRNLNIASMKLFPQSDLLRYQRVYNSNIVLYKESPTTQLMRLDSDRK